MIAFCPRDRSVVNIPNDDVGAVFHCPHGHAWEVTYDDGLEVRFRPARPEVIFNVRDSASAAFSRVGRELAALASR